MLKKSLFSLILLFLVPFSALAIPAITCHCFTDRAYDPARPAAADPYFLATTQNTFFATVFGVDKKTIVLKKQKGTSAEDLWIAYRVAENSASTPEALLLARAAKENWIEVLVPLHLSPATLGTSFSSAINSHATDDQLARVVVDDLFRRFRLLSESELAALRKRGISNQEVILATLISTRRKQPVEKIYREVTGGARSWGDKIAEAQIDINEMEREISVLLK